jgi:multiple sugar transport system ATP-binding protein
VMTPQSFELPLGDAPVAGDGTYTFGIRPENVHVEAGAPVEARVHDIENHGIEKILTLRAGSILVRAGVPARVDVKVEDTIRFGWDPSKVIVFDRQSGANLRAGN